MTRSLPRITAATVLAITGGLVAISAFALVVARAVLALHPELAVRPTDLALLDDLVPLTPFISAFAVANVVAGIALLTGRAWADRLATAIATIATSLGSFALVLVALGHGPAVHDGIDTVAEGLAIIGTFTTAYVAVIVALAFAGAPEAAPRPTVRAGLPAVA
jgi:hypothetical protein